jgi:hypothetical protein
MRQPAVSAAAAHEPSFVGLVVLMNAEVARAPFGTGG